MKSTVKFEGYDIHYTVQGEGEKLVFLHGWPTNARLWDKQVDFFRDRFQTVTIDWLGFGASDKPLDRTYTFGQKREILDAVMKELLAEGGKITLIAHDVGGPAAVLWAAANPEKVRRLILLNTVLYPFSTPLDKMSHFFFGIPVLGNVFVGRFGLRTLMRTLVKSKGKAVKAHIDGILEAYAAAPARLKLKTILEPLKKGKKGELQHVAADFAGLVMPRHLIIARRDPLCYAHIKRLADENPDVPTHLLDRCGHFIPVDAPDALNAILSKILHTETEYRNSTGVR